MLLYSWCIDLSHVFSDSSSFFVEICRSCLHFLDGSGADLNAGLSADSMASSMTDPVTNIVNSYVLLSFDHMQKKLYSEQSNKHLVWSIFLHILHTFAFKWSELVWKLFPLWGMWLDETVQSDRLFMLRDVKEILYVVLYLYLIIK